MKLFNCEFLKDYKKKAQQINKELCETDSIRERETLENEYQDLCDELFDKIEKEGVFDRILKFKVAIKNPVMDIDLKNMEFENIIYDYLDKDNYNIEEAIVNACKESIKDDFSYTTNFDVDIDLVNG